jgi:hypothetical protein
MHPGIAQAIRATAPGVRAATDADLADAWSQISDLELRRQGGEDGQAIIRASMAAVPYLLRLQVWSTAALLLDRALVRDQSPATSQAALPALRAIADATQQPQALCLLARNLASIHPAEAETPLRSALDQAAADKNFELAYTIAADLTNLLTKLGRLREALDMASQTAQYSRQAGVGPWDQLTGQTLQLQILGRMGQHQQVLDQIGALRDQMDKLPAIRTGNETVELWNIREVILDIGRSSALALGEWQRCLDLNAAICASMQNRGATTYELARRRRNNATPLIRLGKFDAAEEILAGCQQVFEDNDDLRGLSMAFADRAALEVERGNIDTASAFARTAIRFAYVRAEADLIAITHGTLATCLAQAGTNLADQRAHRLAAVLIYQLIGMTHELGITRRELAIELGSDVGGGSPLDTLDVVIRITQQTEGVHLDRLVTALQPDRQAVGDALAEILRGAADINAVQDYLQQWEPVIAATVAAAGGDSDAAAQLTPVLDQLAQDQDWAMLAAALRRIIGGDRDGSLPQSLDPIGTVITGRILTRLAQPPNGPAQEDP